MASFQAKTGWDNLRVIEKKKEVIVPIHSNPIRNREFPKNRKKCKNLKNFSLASIEAKTIRDRLRMIQKKCNRSNPFQPNTKYGIPQK